MLLTEFLYEAIFQPSNTPKIARTVIQRPEIWAYIDEFGLRPDDVCRVAVINGLIVGAVWSRLGCSYGKVDGVTPELAISVYPEYRNKGIVSVPGFYHPIWSFLGKRAMRKFHYQ